MAVVEASVRVNPPRTISAMPRGRFDGEAKAIPASTAAVARQEMAIMGERRPSIDRSEMIPPMGAPRAMPMGNVTVASAMALMSNPPTSYSRAAPT